MNKLDVVNLEWTSYPSRDRVTATLVCNYLRTQGVRVLEHSVFDGYHVLEKHKPRLFFITNTVGAPENRDLMIYAKARGILGVSLISEGVFKGDSNLEQIMIWGWNKDKVLYEDMHLQWSERTRAITIRHHPELRHRIKVSGGVGFDNYRISKTLGKDAFLRRFGKSGYTKVVGVGCWDFGYVDSDDPRYPYMSSTYTHPQICRFRQDGLDFDRVLGAVARANKELLFLVKQHPGLLSGHKGSATTTLADLPNVLVIKDEAGIIDCIAAADFWLVYESTTAMEAWLLGKQTCLLNPSGRDFPRDVIADGSPAYADEAELASAIASFYENHELPGFAQREARRRSIIKETIQWDDGLNHVRAGNAILDVLAEHGTPIWRSESWREMLIRAKQHAKWVISRHIWPVSHLVRGDPNRRNCDLTQLRDYAQAKLEEQLQFYRSHDLSLEHLRKIRCA